MPTSQTSPTESEIALRAWEISQQPDRGSDDENWWRAERELLSERPAEPEKKRRISRPRKADGEAEADSS